MLHHRPFDFMSPKFLQPFLPPIHLARVVLSVASFMGLSMLAVPSHAEKADRTQPIHVEANQASYDDLKQIYQLQGRVILSKGSILIKTEQANVSITPEGYQKATATGGEKGLAFMRQKREGLNEFFEGYAEQIDYDSQTDIIQLKGQARLLRLEGSKMVDEVKAPQMIYNGRNETYQAVQGSNGGGRVQAIIAPKIK